MKQKLLLPVCVTPLEFAAAPSEDVRKGQDGYQAETRTETGNERIHYFVCSMKRRTWPTVSFWRGSESARVV